MHKLTRKGAKTQRAPRSSRCGWVLFLAYSCHLLGDVGDHDLFGSCDRRAGADHPHSGDAVRFGFGTSVALPRGARRLDLDEAMRAAMQVRPADARFTAVGRVNNGDVYFFYQAVGGDREVEGRVRVEPGTGRVERKEVPRSFTFAERVVRVRVRDVHTGDFLGAPTRWIAGFFSFMLAVLSVTGSLVWWGRWWWGRR